MKSGNEEELDDLEVFIYYSHCQIRFFHPLVLVQWRTNGSVRVIGKRVKQGKQYVRV
jgi:hypothetical protein